MKTKKRVSQILVFALILSTLMSGFAFAAPTVKADEITIKANGHIQSYGDKTAEGKGAVSIGTVGESKRIEALGLELVGAPADMKIRYKAHVQTYGDSKDWIYGPAAVGTKGEAKRLEGIQIELVDAKGEKYPGYSVKYRVHMQSFGWGKDNKDCALYGKADSWAVDGEFAGSKGFAKRLEAIEIQILKEDELKVVSVSANNLKEIEVKFNNAVDSATVKDANFTVKKGTTTVATTATVKEDGKTIVLTVKAAGAHLENQATYTVEVKDVKNTAGKAVKTTTETFKAFDATLPELLEIKVTGPRTFDLIFSEPIKNTGGSVTMKSANNTIAVNPSFERNDTNTVSVSLYTNMVDGTVYEVSVKEFEDFAGYRNVVDTFMLAYSKDNAAPVATIEKVEQSYVVVKFDKPVSGLTKDHFYHTFTAWTAVGIYKDAEMSVPVGNDKVSTVYVQFYDANATKPASDLNRPIPEGQTNFFIRATANGKTITDNWTNKFVDSAFTITASSDKVAPAVTAIETKSERSFKVTFNKDVKLSTKNVEILNVDGKSIAGLNISIDKASGKEFVVNFGKDLPGETILITFKDVVDTTLAENKMPLYTSSLLIQDKTEPKVNRVDYKETGTGEGELFIIFNEPVDADTALVASNYFIYDNGYTQLTGTPTFYSGNTIVRIPLTADQATNITSKQLFVTNVKDINGNKIIPETKDITSVTNNKPAVDTANVKATDRQTIVIPFDQFVTGLTEASINVIANSIEVKVASLSIATNENGNVVATVGLANKIPADTDNVTVSVAANAVENEFGQKNIAANNIAVNDKIAPEVDKIQFVNAKEIHVFFTEELNDKTFAATGKNGFSVAGGTLTKAYNVTSNKKLVVLQGTDFTINTDVLYNGTNGIADKAGNALKAFNETAQLEAIAITAAGFAKPVWVANTDNKADVNIQFSKMYAGEAEDGYGIFAIDSETKVLTFVPSKITNQVKTDCGSFLTPGANPYAVPVVFTVPETVDGATIVATTLNGANVGTDTLNPDPNYDGTPYMVWLKDDIAKGNYTYVVTFDNGVSLSYTVVVK